MDDHAKDAARNAARDRLRVGLGVVLDALAPDEALGSALSVVTASWFVGSALVTIAMGAVGRWSGALAAWALVALAAFVLLILASRRAIRARDEDLDDIVDQAREIRDTAAQGRPPLAPPCVSFTCACGAGPVEAPDSAVPEVIARALPDGWSAAVTYASRSEGPNIRTRSARDVRCPACAPGAWPGGLTPPGEEVVRIPTGEAHDADA